MGFDRPSVLVFADTDTVSLCTPLLERGATIALAHDLADASSQIDEGCFDVVFVGVGRPGDAESVARLHQKRADIPLVAFGVAAHDRDALRAGAAEYLTLPLAAESVAFALESAVARARFAGVEPPASPAEPSGLLGESPLMVAVRDRIARAAPGNSTVFVRGETGTGKELAARAIHAGSSRREGPFIKVDAGALPENLLESELFGYERGAFTGATSRKPGRVELAEGGTLFLDEIGEISLAMQAKLLRLLQDREYERLGGTRTLKADVRFLSATHRDVEHMIETGAFRQDLFHRLNVVPVWLPPLRARRGDIPLIAQHYLSQFRSANRKPSIRLDDEAMHLLQSERWVGNVRELVNFLEKIVVLATGDVIGVDEVRSALDEHAAFTTQSVPQDPELLRVLAAARPAASAGAGGGFAAEPAGARPASAESGPKSTDSAVRPLEKDMYDAEHRALVKALNAAKQNKALAARMLGISRRTLYTKLEQHGLR